MPALATSSTTYTADRAPDRDDRILRFRRSERHLHWALAVPFLINLGTALVLVVFYNPHPARPYRAVFSWIHRLSGVALAGLPPLTMIRHRGDFGMYLHNLKQAWIWNADDLRWLFLMGPATFSSKVSLPHQGKFNAAEKINFMVLTLTYPLFVLTGLMIWLPGVALLSWLVHFAMAVVATPLILGHIFMATINPETRPGLSGMFSGLVDRHWARHHYTRWYREHFESGDPAPMPPAPEPLDAEPNEVPALAVIREGGQGLPADWPMTFAHGSHQMADGDLMYPAARSNTAFAVTGEVPAAETLP